MGKVNEARKIIRETETDVSQKKYTIQWAQDYARAGKILSGSGEETEATHAQWMALLMSLRAVPETQRDGRGESYFAPELCSESSGRDTSRTVVVTEEMLDFYIQKCDTLRNPILIARCCDIIWELRRSHNWARQGVKAHADAARLFVDRLEGTQVKMHLVRAVELAMRLNDKNLLDPLKQQWESAMSTLSAADRPGAVLHLIDIEEQFQSCLREEDRQRLAERCEFFAAVYAEHNDYGTERMWLGKAVGLHHKIRQSDCERRCKVTIAESFRREGQMYLAAGNCLMAVHFLQQARERFTKLDPPDVVQADEIGVVLGQVQPKAVKQIPYVGVQAPIPSEVLDEWTARLAHMSVQEAFHVMFFDKTLMPDVAALRRQVEETKTTQPFMDSMPVEMLDNRNVVARPEPDDLDEFYLFQHMSMQWQVAGYLMARLVWTVLDGRGVSLRDFDVLLSGSLIQPARDVIERGLERYLQKDFISALHIFVTQFEKCLRHMLRTLGRPSSRPKRGKKGISEERPLDDLLRDSVLEINLGEDICYLYRFLFTDQRGWNLRNRICHGLADSTDFVEPYATVVLYALLSFGWFEPVSDETGGVCQADSGDTT